MVTIFGNVLKWLLKPIGAILSLAFIDVLIVGPLRFVNQLNKLLQIFSGASVDKLIFNTSLMDGKKHINFFSYDSPLKSIFFIAIIVGVVLLFLNLSISFIQSTMKKNSLQIIGNKIKNTLFSLVTLIAIPIMFLIALSLSGAFVNLFGNQNHSAGIESIKSYQSETKNNLLQFNSINDSMTDAFIHKDSTQIDENGDLIVDFSNWTMEEIYKNAVTHNVNETMSLLIETNKTHFTNLKKLLFANYGTIKNNLELSTSLVDYINSGIEIINKLEIGKKNENDSEKIQNIINYLASISKEINMIKESGKEIIEQKTVMESQTNAWIKSYEAKYNSLFEKSTNNTIHKINTIQDLNNYITLIIASDGISYEHSLIKLRNDLTDYVDHYLIVSLYQYSLNTNSSNWNSLFNLYDGNGQFIIGAILIGLVAYALASALIFIIQRIFKLAVYFVCSPIIVFRYPIDEGKMFKKYLRSIIGELISIFGLVITMRIFYLMNDQMENIIGKKYYLLPKIIVGIAGLFSSIQMNKKFNAMITQNSTKFKIPNFKKWNEFNNNFNQINSSVPTNISHYSQNNDAYENRRLLINNFRMENRKSNGNK